MVTMLDAYHSLERQVSLPSQTLLNFRSTTSIHFLRKMTSRHLTGYMLDSSTTTRQFHQLPPPSIPWTTTTDGRLPTVTRLFGIWTISKLSLSEIAAKFSTTHCSHQIYCKFRDTLMSPRTRFFGGRIANIAVIWSAP